MKLPPNYDHYNITERSVLRSNALLLDGTSSLAANHRVKYTDILPTHDSIKEVPRSVKYSRFYTQKGQYQRLTRDVLLNEVLSSSELELSMQQLTKQLNMPNFSLDALWLTVDFTINDLAALYEDRKILSYLSETTIKEVNSGKLSHLYSSCDNFNWASGAKAKMYNCATHYGHREARFVIPLDELLLDEIVNLFYAHELILGCENYKAAFKNAFITKIEPSLTFYNVPYLHLWTIDSHHKGGTIFPAISGKNAHSSSYDGPTCKSSHTVSYDSILNLLFKGAISVKEASYLLLTSKIERSHIPYSNNNEKLTMSNLPYMNCDLTRSKVLNPLSILELPSDLRILLARLNIREAKNQLQGKELSHLLSFLSKDEHYLPMNKNRVCSLQHQALTRLKILIMDPSVFIA